MPARRGRTGSAGATGTDGSTGTGGTADPAGELPDGCPVPPTPSRPAPRRVLARWRDALVGLPGHVLRRPRRHRQDPGHDAGAAVAPSVPRVAVVTDSTSCLTPADAAAWGIDVIALDVAADGTRYRDGVDLAPEDLAALLASGHRVTTSQPPPAAFAAAYEAAAARGAVEVVSVHLSGELSGTVRAAGLAAQLAPLPVHVVDSRSAGAGLGFAALAAAELARGDVWGRVPDGGEVGEVAEQVGRSTSAWFVVDSLDHLRRGGRLSGAAAAFGTVLGLRPVLALRDGRIEVAERVRTRRAARDRLHDLAVAEVQRRGPGVRVAVQHLGRHDVAAELAERVRVDLTLDEVLVREVGAVLGGHLGVGVLAVTVVDR